ncbi:MAG: hypothetical protein AVDCRST_MAG88-2272, partial [uncultured Thermomicrobiales bacterium]
CRPGTLRHWDGGGRATPPPATPIKSPATDKESTPSGVATGTPALACLPWRAY